MPKTISFHNGFSWSRGHNIRDHRFVKAQAHIDKSLESQNVIIRDEPVRQAYDRIFGESVREYNSKQQRSDRKIKSYYDKIKNDKKKRVVYECVVQIGNNNDTGNNALPEKEALRRFAEEWEQRNPNLLLIGAYIHADEPNGTVHMHMDYIPIAECSRGMKLQNSFDRALEQQGFHTYSKKQTAQIAWQERERKALVEICEEMNIDVYKTPQGITKGRGHLSKAEYQILKDIAREEVENELLPYKAIIEDSLQAEPESTIEGVSVPPAAKLLISKDNRDKRLYSAEDVEKIQQLAKATAVISAKNQQDRAELDQRYANITELELKAEQALNIANMKKGIAEEKIQKAAAIKQEADEYVAHMQEFYAEQFPYVQSLTEENAQLKEEIVSVKQSKDKIIADIVKDKNEMIDSFRLNKNRDNEKIKHLEKELSDMKPLQEQNNQLTEQVRTLENEVKEKDGIISRLNEKIQELIKDNDILTSIYETACEIGRYICDKLRLDFDYIHSKRIHGYRLSYLIDEGHGRER